MEEALFRKNTKNFLSFKTDYLNSSFSGWPFTSNHPYFIYDTHIVQKAEYNSIIFVGNIS